MCNLRRCAELIPYTEVRPKGEKNKYKKWYLIELQH
jgi:hypothetical protein